MSATLSVSLTRAVTINGVAYNKTVSKDITVDGRVLAQATVEVGAAAVKTIFNLADTDYSGVLAASGGTADFDYAEIHCEDGEDAVNMTFVEIGGDVGGDDYICIELRKGSVLTLINGDAIHEGRTGNGLVTYANLGSVGTIDSIRVANRSGATVAKFSLFVVT